MTRIAILRTGAPPAGLAADHGDYPAMFRDLLGQGFETQTFNVQAGEWPDPADFDGAIVTGSSAGVYETDPWIADLLNWIRAAKGQTRLVGVCFGHQAMAQALGGRVEKSNRGWGVGLHRYAVPGREPWMREGGPDVIALSASHQDQVIEKPAEARATLSSDFTPFAGLAYDDDAISFQPHPEFTRTFTGALTDGRRGVIDQAVVDEALATLEAPDDRALVGGWIRAFLEPASGT